MQANPIDLTPQYYQEFCLKHKKLYEQGFQYVEYFPNFQNLVELSINIDILSKNYLNFKDKKHLKKL